ncbi:Uncharacterised protein [Klebsiella pneumoniae]|nr:Uncharacterised protein [Klebsiella pneumoniae]
MYSEFIKLKIVLSIISLSNAFKNKWLIESTQCAIFSTRIISIGHKGNLRLIPCLVFDIPRHVSPNTQNFTPP